MDHELIPPTFPEQVLLVVPCVVDVGVCTCSAHRVCGVRFGWRYLINRVADDVQPVFRFSVGRCGEGKEDGR